MNEINTLIELQFDDEILKKSLHLLTEQNFNYINDVRKLFSESNIKFFKEINEIFTVESIGTF